MPRRTEDQQDNKLSTLLGLTQLQNARQQADTESTGALVKMLGDLYGLSLVPEKIAQTRAETELAKQHADYYAAQQETPQTRQLYNTFQALQYAKFLGLPDEHIQPIARQALRNSGYDLPEPVKPREEFGAGEATTPSAKPGFQIPPEYAGDPQFQALLPAVQKRQQQQTAEESTLQSNAAIMRRTDALEALKRQLGLSTPKPYTSPYGRNY